MSKMLKKIESMKVGETIALGAGGMDAEEIEAMKDMIKSGKFYLDPDALNEEIVPRAHKKYTDGDAIAVFMKYIKA